MGRRPVSSLAPAAASLEGLYRRHAAWLARSLRRRFRYLSGAGAEDLVQDTYLKIAPEARRTDLRHPRAFLLQVATHLAYDDLRRRSRQGSSALAIETLEETTEHGVWAEQDETVLLRQLILGLPDPIRDVFILSRFAGLTNQEIADHLGLSVKAVEGRMTKALARLARALDSAPRSPA